LKAQLNDRSEPGSGKGRSIQKLSDVDAQKLHKRLKESFKEQIGLFREGVYLLTGYKIEMLQTSGEHSERPQFKVRSMYAEVRVIESVNIYFVLILNCLLELA